jgi:NTE family protein
VLIVAPMGTSGRGLSRVIQDQLQREIAELEAVGATVMLVQPDAAALEEMGPNFMDPTRRAEAVAAGSRQAREHAPAIRAFWK